MTARRCDRDTIMLTMIGHLNVLMGECGNLSGRISAVIDRQKPGDLARAASRRCASATRMVTVDKFRPAAAAQAGAIRTLH
ncbi:hypothetical protein MBT84_43240 [Streptomyces sp. MBT84]|uniref:hypothetical protein n=1 Tax=Streptomyces sp. MBT84 TaxID=1488414 RepID=UPI001C6E2F7D|nr:hypothetical protein [Streptomyces sp. MBT84]MBW8706458.1 hypothetical protein [Streptomyces sp. MBT84]